MYKSALNSGAAPSPDTNQKYRPQARQLQELFPSWSNDDLQSLLHEVGGDVEIAATRISEGHAEQWGAVTRKKDKKPSAPTHVSKESSSGSRGDLRGARGGVRGGRGGSVRGGASPRARGGVVRPTNGHHVAAVSPSPSANAWADGPPGIDKPVADKPVDAAWATPEPAATSSWTDSTDTPSATPASWGNTKEPDLNGSAQPKVLAKTPATSKMSWAQIARPQEKPTPPPAPSPVVAPPPVAAPVAPEPEAQTQLGWEDPTTVQTPSWEEEAPVIKPSTSAADVWPSTVAPAESLEQPKPELNLAEAQPEEIPAAPAIVESIAAPTEPETAPPAASPSPKPIRPSSSAHRHSARYKVTDQAVVMPSSFGSGLEKVGMQFGSLSLGGETSFDNQPEPEAAPEPQPTAASPPAPQSAAPVHHDTPPQASVPPTSTSLGSSLFQGLPPQAQVSSHTLPSSVSQPIVSQQKSAPLNEPLASQPMQQQQEHSQLTAQQQYMQQHISGGGYMPPQLPLQQQQPQQPQPHLAQQSHSHQYSQHGLPTHIDPSQPNPQHPANSAHSNYFRNEATPNPSSPYGFHAPTPPVGQAQDTPYGTFSPLGGQGQQAGHLSSFGQDYGHDNQRGFYDSYQTSTFNRGVLGHDDAKGLAGGQQQQANAGGLPPSAQSGAQLGNAQNASQQQPPAAGPQGQQYAMHPSYYYPFPQNQYYGTPYNAGYNVAPYVKYPTMYGGPPGPGNAPAPGQQAQSNIGVKGQGQAAGQGAYGPAQGVYQSGYDDYPGQPQTHGGHQQQHSLGLAQGGAEYGKPLYGAGQSFMGLGGQGPSGGPQGGNARGGSPETQYKPYGKDVGVAGRGSAGVQQGQGQGQQGQGQAQGAPPGQGFYGGNRFGGAGASGPQQNAHHQSVPGGHLGYSQAQNDFYPYQGRQQQQFWQ